MHPDRQKLFWSKVNICGEAECWEWTAAKNRQGYGRFSYRQKDHKAHRIAKMLTHGDIPPDKIVMHLCNNPSCVNPAHLEIGDHRENALYAIACGRTPKITECAAGHPFTAETTYFSPSGHRSCKICRKVVQQKNQAARNAKLKKERAEIAEKIKLAGHTV